LGNDGNYYAVTNLHRNGLFSTGSSLAPTPASYTYVDIRLSSNVYQIEFPVGHGNIEKIVTNNQNAFPTFMALDDTGKIYAWGFYQNATYALFETSETNYTLVGAANYFPTPVLINTPATETGFKDVSLTYQSPLSMFIGNSGALYKIGNRIIDATYILGLSFGDPTFAYQKILSSGDNFISIQTNEVNAILINSNNKILTLGRNEYGVLGGLPGEVSPFFNVNRNYPTPLLNGNHDANNPNPQVVN